MTNRISCPDCRGDGLVFNSFTEDYGRECATCEGWGFLPIPRLTREGFEEGYASRSGVTVEWLHVHGQFAIFCHCGEEGCEGWQMAHRDDLGEQVNL